MLLKRILEIDQMKRLLYLKNTSIEMSYCQDQNRVDHF